MATPGSDSSDVMDELDARAQKVAVALAEGRHLSEAVRRYLDLWLENNDPGATRIADRRVLERLADQVVSNSALEPYAAAVTGEVVEYLAARYPVGYPSSDPSKGNVKQDLDPVMLHNGQFVHTVVDLRIDGAGIGFAFARTYKNGSSAESVGE